MYGWYYYLATSPVIHAVYKLKSFVSTLPVHCLRHIGAVAATTTVAATVAAAAAPAAAAVGAAVAATARAPEDRRKRRIEYQCICESIRRDRGRVRSARRRRPDLRPRS